VRGNNRNAGRSGSPSVKVFTDFPDAPAS
jgi:hypothetical protein